MDSSPRFNPRLRGSEPLRRCRLEECRAACCLHGAWVDSVEADDLRAHAGLIRPHLPPDQADPGDWFDGRRAADPHALSGEVVHTRVLPAPDHYGGTACVFLREDWKCALQVAAEGEGLHPWRFKPFYCVMHPLDLDAEGNLTLDAAQALLDDPASCLRRADAPRPLAETLEPELRYLLGEKGYAKLADS